MIWDEFLRHFRFCDEEDSGLSDEEQERKGPKNRPKHTRKRIHQAKKNFLEKFKTASKRAARIYVNLRFLYQPFFYNPTIMRKPLTPTQCVVLALFWAALCFIVLTSSPQIDGMLILTILISGALVFIPIVKALKKK